MVLLFYTKNLISWIVIVWNVHDFEEILCK